MFFNRPVFRLAFGAALALFAANELFRPRIKKELHLTFGVLAGFMGGFLSEDQGRYI